MKFSRYLICAGLLLMVCSSASADTIPPPGGTAIVRTSLGPNLFCPGCAGVSGYTTNAILGLPLGVETGNFNIDPSAYNLVSTVAPWDFMVSTFQSWRGVAPGLFAPEEGTRLYFGLYVLSPEILFSLSQVTYIVTDTDAVFPPNGYFSASGDFSTSVYDAAHVGIRFGTPDIIYNSGQPGTNLINALIYVGLAPAFDASLYSGATNQAKLNAAIADAQTLGTYSLQVCYSATTDAGVLFNVCAADIVVPEPSTTALLGLGLASLLVVGRRLTRRLRS